MMLPILTRDRAADSWLVRGSGKQRSSANFGATHPPSACSVLPPFLKQRLDCSAGRGRRVQWVARKGVKVGKSNTSDECGGWVLCLWGTENLRAARDVRRVRGWNGTREVVGKSKKAYAPFPGFCSGVSSTPPNTTPSECLCWSGCAAVHPHCGDLGRGGRRAEDPRRRGNKRPRDRMQLQENRRVAGG